MGVIKKKASTAEDSPEIQDWSAGKTKIPLTKQKRVLRGDRVEAMPMQQYIPQFNLADNGPSVKPIVENEVITGIVVTCKCGEKTMVYFDYGKAPE